MKFWDSSILVPLVVDEPRSAIAKSLAEADPAILVSFITPIEVDSAIWRKARSTRDPDARQRAQHRLAILRNEWIVVDNYVAVLNEARRMVGRHGLRGADAIQLAAAVIVRGSGSLPFVTFDDELIAAARAEGFPVLP